jgi:hypothetical protein
MKHLKNIKTGQKTKKSEGLIREEKNQGVLLLRLYARSKYKGQEPFPGTLPFLGRPRGRKVRSL